MRTTPLASLAAICLGLMAFVALGQTGTAGAADRPWLSREDLPRLKQLDRAQVLATIGSFEDRGLSETEFVRQMGALLDARRVPGLAEALAAGNTAAAVHRACLPAEVPAGQASVSPEQRQIADDVLAHRFSFYGESYQLPTEIDWDHNPGTAHWGHDLNRFTYLEPLTQVYLATRDARYSRKAVELILDWIAKSDIGQCFRGTPYMFGSYLNNALHCEAWSRCLTILLTHNQVRPAELLRILKSLHDQIAYLEIVTNGHDGNWPIIGCRGMLSSMAAFPVLRDTDRFTANAARTYKVQLQEQILPDGAQWELTPHYHRVVVTNVLGIVSGLRRLGRPVDPDVLTRLRKMIHYVQQTAVPDGSKQVAFNDSDPGTPGNLTPQLAELGLQDLLSPAARLGPERFPYAGVAFLRQRQDRGDLYLAFDAGPYGRSHQHEDKLSFWLSAYGRNFIVDPGRHLYDHSAVSYFRYLRSTTAHSTIKIDGLNQRSASRRETWVARKPIDLGWRMGPDEVRASGAYDLGYGPKNDVHVVHRREIVFVRERCWVVFDSVEGVGEHLIESRFQFSPGKVILENGGARTDFKDANLTLRTVAAVAFSDSHLEEGQENPRGGWYSDSYGKIEPAPALSMSLRTRLPWRAATVLFPWRGTVPPHIDLVWDGAAVRIRAPELDEARVEYSLESMRSSPQ